jgi:hypothetical protein
LNNKKFRIWLVIGALLGIILLLQACSSLNATQDMPARATWTPVAQPTDQPYQVEAKAPPYFGDTPALVIFGSHDPGDNSPLQAINLSTEDDYDVAALTPGPISTWSRPIMAEDNTLFFQIGPELYKLLPGGGVTELDLPFDEADPVFCNWSWKGQIVCLNGLMTEGYLVDQDLNLVEMSLPAYAPADTSVAFYAPYRVGENTMRVVQTKTSKVGKKYAVHYRDLALDTLTISNQQIGLKPNFFRSFVISSSSTISDLNPFIQSDENMDVLGIRDDGQVVLLLSLYERTDDSGNRTSSIFLADFYDVQDESLVRIDTIFNTNNPENEVYQNQLVTTWVEYDDFHFQSWPGVYDLTTGELFFDASEAFDDRDMYTEILPYGENWLVGSYYGIGFINEYGLFMAPYHFPDEIVGAYEEDGSYVVSQPMEP